MTAVVSRYARALFEVAGRNEQVIEEMKVLCGVIADDKKLLYLLKAPSVKSKVLNAMTEGMSSIMVDFCQLLLTSNRLDVLEKILIKCLQMVRESKNEIDIEVTSVLPLSAEQLGAISDKISSDQQVNITNILNESILGGLVIKRGYNVMDLSLKNKLEQLQMISKKGVLACN